MLLSLFLVTVSAQQCTKIVTRKEVTTLTAAEWDTFVSTIQRAQTTRDTEFPNLSVWEAAAHVHNLASREIHWTCLFFPWHRAFLASMEQKLQKLNPSFSFPYFDSGRVATSASSSIIWSKIGANYGSPVRGDIFGGRRLNGGYNIAIRREAGASLNQQVSTVLYSNLLQRSLTSGNRGFSDWAQNMEIYHGNLHIAVGGGYGQMSGMFSPLDPLFYMHHAFFDYMWFVAQNQWAASRLPQLGNRLASGQQCAASSSLPRLSKTVRDVIDTRSVCVAYSAPPSTPFRGSLKSNMTEADQEEVYCPPPLPASWVKMQEEGSAQKDFIEREKKLNSVCQNVTVVIKNGGQIPDFPVVENNSTTIFVASEDQKRSGSKALFTSSMLLLIWLLVL
jgi:tyrosinase